MRNKNNKSAADDNSGASAAATSLYDIFFTKKLFHLKINCFGNISSVNIHKEKTYVADLAVKQPLIK